MLSVTLKTLNGKEVQLNVPQNASEIPLNRFVRAKLAYLDIDAIFGEKLFGTEYRFLQKVIEFISFTLNVPANDLMGFRTGSVKDNAETLAFGITQTQTWEKADKSIYALYSHLVKVFREAGPKEHEGDLEFTYKGEEFFIPKFINTMIQAINIVPIDMQAWQGIELAEVQRQVSNYADKLVPVDEYGNYQAEGGMTDEEYDKYADVQFRGFLNVLAILARKRSDNVADVIMQGQHHVDEYIATRSRYFQDIDTQTAVDCFFFGLNIGQWYVNQIGMNIFLTRQDRLQRLKEKRRAKK